MKAGFALMPYGVVSAPNLSVATGMIIDATTEKIACKYTAATTSPITSVAMNLAITGLPGSFIIGVYGDAGGYPDDATQYGTSTPAFAAPAASGWTGDKTLGTNTGTLTIGKAYWIVVSYSSGTIDATNYIQLRTFGGISPFNSRLRHHNGTNWTTTAAVNGSPTMVLTHLDASLDGGVGVTVADARSAQADIFVNAGTSQVQGCSMKFGSKVTIAGVSVLLTKTGAPGNLIVKLYEGDTEKASTTITATEITTALYHFIPFSSPQEIAADATSYIIFSQTGTSDTNDYDISTTICEAAYLSTVLPTGFRFVYGSGVPSGLTVSTTEAPIITPIVFDPATAFDCAAAGGGLIVNPGMTGGING